MTTATATIKLSRQDIEQLPNYRHKSGDEYSASCPFCGTGDDRFLYWPDAGNYWCRVCEATGFVVELSASQITSEQRAAFERAKLERKEAERQQQLSAIERIREMADRVDFYHSQVDKSLDYWHGQGLDDSTISRYKLGYSHLCPTYPKSPSYVIPYYQQNNLISIRHRLAYPNGSGKYRPEFAGLPAQLFNLDSLIPDELSFNFLDDKEVVLVEGEIKAMVLDQFGFRTVGLPGFNTWRDKFIAHFKPVELVYIAFDPGPRAIKVKAYQIAKLFASAGMIARVVTLPEKPDDLFVKYGCDQRTFLKLLHQGRRVN